MIRWLRGETVGDLCREIAHISCAAVAEGFFCPLFCRMYLSFYRLYLFSCRRRLCVLSFCRLLLILCVYLDTSTTWDSRLLPIYYVGSALFARSIRDFRPGSGFIGCGRVVKRKLPVSFTPNPMNYNYLLYLCEG